MLLCRIKNVFMRRTKKEIKTKQNYGVNVEFYLHIAMGSGPFIINMQLVRNKLTVSNDNTHILKWVLRYREFSGQNKVMCDIHIKYHPPAIFWNVMSRSGRKHITCHPALSQSDSLEHASCARYGDGSGPIVSFPPIALYWIDGMHVTICRNIT